MNCHNVVKEGTQTGKEEIAKIVTKRKSEGLKTPHLAAILVGSDGASMTYVNSKVKSCEKVGFNSTLIDLPEDTTEEQLLNEIDDLNKDADIDGFIVQLPLPKQIDEQKVLMAVDPNKDVDGFHPVNIGRLAQKGREPLFVPCTPAGCMILLEKAGAQIEGANAVVVGRSNIVGMPAALLLVKANATTTICHSRTKDLPAVCREADILIAAIGRAEMIRGDWIKPGAYVIDVGMNRVDDPSRERGYRLTGDVAFDEAMEVAAAITPVPGGVGPMTIAGLLANTLRSAQRTLP